MSVATKVVPAGLALALAVAAAGAALERSRFGRSDADAIARVQVELQQRFDQSAESLAAIASQVAAQRDAIRAAPRDPAAAQRLFAALDAALPADRRESSGITVYSTAGAPLAWAGRVSEFPRQTIGRGETMFVASGAPGPRLLLVQPLVDRARTGAPLEATVVVELVMGTTERGAVAADTVVVDTSVVPVAVGAGSVSGSRPDQDRFPIVLQGGTPLIEASVSPTDLANARAAWTRSTWAGALAVLAITLLLCAGPLIDLRRVTKSTQTYLLATAGLGALIPGAWAILSAAARLFFWPKPSEAPTLLLAGLTLAGLVWLSLDLIERRRYVRPKPQVLAPTATAALLAAGGYAAAGVVATWVLWRYERTLHDLVGRTAVDLLHFSHNSLTPERLGLAVALVLLHAAVIWAAAGISRVPSLLWRTPRSLVRLAVTGWAAGGLITAMSLPRANDTLIAMGPLLLALAATGGAAVFLGRLRSGARRGSQTARLLALFFALLVPTLAMYPSLASFTTAERERLVSSRFAPEVVRLREDLQVRVQHAIEQIDPKLRTLELSVPPGEGTAGSDPAFRIWSQTDLAAYRLTSSVEVYGADQRLISRFALKLPPEEPATRYRAGTCDWSEFDETSPFGSNEHVLHYSRDICRQGRVLGTIVVRAMLDYRTLSFITSQSPYLEALGPERQPPPELRSEGGIEFVVYGWSRAPLFIGTSAWTLPDPVFERMVESRSAIWTTIDRDSEPFRVYLFNDRAGIYSLGYPVVTWFGHLINLVEVAALTLGPLYVVLLAIATLFGALVLRTPASGRTLLREIRSSFYRKLFLYYVAGAVVPVFTLAIATRTYFATELRAGIDEAAAKTATVAERLVEDYATLQQRGAGALESIDDQIMVLVGQAIDHDVSLFDRARLQATSEKDLFESQILSARTPASVYRAILLDRLPTFVADETIGDVRYRLAAAPVRAGGREAIVTVPLTLQQEEIEQQIDELDHRILFGAVLFSLLGAALGYWLAERIADPVNRLTRATRRIARGDLNARIATTSSDELRRLVEDFNQMAADLQRQRANLERTQRLEAWADMARQVAHDIKNPLTPIQLSAEHARRVNIDRGRPLSPVLDECVSSILTQVRLLRQISTEFSSFASSPTPRPETTSLPALIEEVIGPYRTGLEGRIDIESHAAADLPIIQIDRTLFARAMTNIIENALHAMPGKGQLTIAARRPAAAEDQTVVVEITDTGIGMDEQAVARIFEPYFSTKATGTGLGLTIAKRNVELNGGTIAVTSERGVGTTVTLTLRA